jgi:hypothetical protein
VISVVQFALNVAMHRYGSLRDAVGEQLQTYRKIVKDQSKFDDNQVSIIAKFTARMYSYALIP